MSFSREYITLKANLRQGVIGIHFKPNSNSAKSFGLFIVLAEVTLSEIEMQLMDKNIKEKIDTYGIISGIHIKDSQKLKISFNTEDIYKVDL